MKYVSMTLFGDSRLYNEGAIINAKLCRKYLKDYEPLFYISESAPALKALQNIATVEVMPHVEEVRRSTDNIIWHQDGNSRFMAWRYYALERSDCDRAVFADVDARISPRLSSAINLWENSDYLALCMFECEHHHNGGVAPGISAVVGGLHNNLRKNLESYYNFYVKNGGVPIFYDIHAFRDVILNEVNYSVLKMGYGCDIAIPDVPMPEGMGRFCGDVVSPEWRNEIYGN
jgi:hypothetical protein